MIFYSIIVTLKYVEIGRHSKIALKAVEIKFLMEARSGKPEQIKTDIDELIQLLHLLPVNHGFVFKYS